MRKKLLRVALCLLVLFILTNISWCFWRIVKYGAYNTGMEKDVFSTWLVPRYIHTDTNGYNYNVKYPDYMMFTGNLGVSFPMGDEDLFNDGLIIWLKPFGGYEYGVLLYDSEGMWQIYINPDGSAIAPEDNVIVARHQENVDTLLRKAQEMWDLG